MQINGQIHDPPDQKSIGIASSIDAPLVESLDTRVAIYLNSYNDQQTGWWESWNIYWGKK
jgi:hypothetical protein